MLTFVCVSDCFRRWRGIKGVDNPELIVYQIYNLHKKKLQIPNICFRIMEILKNHVY